MLIPMVLKSPLKAWHYATITTLGSLVGSLLGYAIGYFAFELIAVPFLETLGYQAAYQKVAHWFSQYGFAAVILAGFTPIPYKLFTIAAGATHMILIPFLGAAILGRSVRFFLVAAFVRHFGPKMETHLFKYIDIIAYATLILVGLIALFYYYF